MADMVDVVLVLRNVSQFVSGAEQSSKAISGVGESAEKSGKQASGGWKSMLKWAGGAAAFYGATKFIRSSVDATTDLTKSTLALQRQTGMDTQTASEWVSLTKERGISAKQLQTSLTKLDTTIQKGADGNKAASTTIASLRSQIDAVSKAGGKDAPKQMAKLSAQIDKAQASGTKAAAIFTQLGVPLDDLQKGNSAAVLGKVADAMQKMTNPAQRAALAQKLFGRSGQQLVPILMQGQAGIDKLLKSQKDYGNYLTDKSIKQNQKMIEQQRDLEKALAGLKLQLGQALLPVLVAFGKILVKLAAWLRPLTSNAKALQIVIGTIVGLLVTYKTVTMAVATAEKVAETATKLWTAAQWLFNAAMDANPIGLVIIAVGALVVAFVLAYKKIGWFRDGVNAALHAVLAAAEAVWGWIKSNWPLLAGILLGPFGLVAAEIIQHFSAIKGAAVTAFNAIKGVVVGVFNAIRGSAISAINAIKAAISGLLSTVTSIPDKINSIAKKVPGVSAIESAFAEGGTARRAGHYLVGERGPEVVSLPGGAVVTPMMASGSLAANWSGGRPLEVHVPVTLDGKHLTKVVARVTADQLARR